MFSIILYDDDDDDLILFIQVLDNNWMSLVTADH
jgi:hypothetical protein